MPPMTPRQKDYLTRLIAERVERLRQLAEQRDHRAAYLAQHPDGGNLTVRQASEAITYLLGVQPGQGIRPAADAVDVPAGRYAIVNDEGVVKFYKVDRPTEGRWTGYTFVKVQASEEWHPVRNRESRDEILAAIATDPTGAMRRYGIELGRCGNCGRLLTDETSRQMGIGPDCAQRLGLDRSPYAEAARREQVARLRATYTEPSEDEVYDLAARLDIHPDEARVELAIEAAEARDAVMDADDLMAEAL
jgi:hypothetical protein